ncbi:hypothetical protein FRB90_012860, partial [Tulasnella sp. 427]
MSNRNNNRNKKQHPNKDTGPLTQDPQDVMSTAMRLQWNIRVLQRHDPAITTIVDQFTYAVLYRYEDDSWVKRGVEGSMFVYTRTDPPIHGFCILNREGVGNFVQPLRRGDDMEVADDYIIYRALDVGLDEYERFIGIWTADVAERKRLSDFMMKNGSPALAQQHPAQQQQQYIPRNNSLDQNARQIDRDVASEALLQALRSPGNSIIQGHGSTSLSKDLFIQELLGLIHRTLVSEVHDPKTSDLVIIGRGLGLQKIVCTLLQIYDGPQNLVLLINASAEEEKGIGSQLGTMGVRNPGLRIVDYEMSKKDRQLLYKKGGLISVTSRILVVDLLQKDIPVDLITGMVILHAE